MHYGVDLQHVQFLQVAVSTASLAAVPTTSGPPRTARPRPVATAPARSLGAARTTSPAQGVKPQTLNSLIPCLWKNVRRPRQQGLRLPRFS